ncbi:MAG: aryl-sulfate sulfotransferase, partial [Polyangiaceae bacterium]|nr:aryl-sulfate sulfotransferase [Polyangiaceae bacterium]
VMPNYTNSYANEYFEILDLAAQTTTSLRAVGAPTDPHELQRLPNGNYLLFADPTRSGVDLTGLKSYRANESIADCEIQEIDPSGALVWSWDASDHVDPVSESLEPALIVINNASLIDVFHCNSIEVDASGNLLVSMRYENAVYYIDRESGRIMWKLGGTPTNMDGAQYIAIVGDPQGGFVMQHDARFRPSGNISLFDDHSVGSNVVARGVEYAIDWDSATATLAWQFLGVHLSGSQGGFRRYADGESVVGWGYAGPDFRFFTEVDAYGNDVFDLSVTPYISSYRVVKVDPSVLDINLLRQTTALF